MKGFLKRLAHSLGYEVRRIAPPPLGPLPPLADESSGDEFDRLKSFASRAAHSVSPAGETEAVRRLYLTGLLGPASAPDGSRIAIGGAHTREIGIWRRDGAAEDAPFQRRKDRSGEWFYWAGVDRITPKKTRWRVALLGESVARGYLYDPHFNPAISLQGILGAELGEGAIEVIDLAKSNLTLDQLKPLVGQCLALKPDLIVVFAGNNWVPHLAESDIPHVDPLVREGGAPALKSYLDGQAQRAARHLARQVADVLERFGGLPIIWVIPDSNLADWTDPESGAPLLPRQDTQRWRELDRLAGQAMRDGDLPRAEELARELTGLDGGTNAIPLRILAECRRAAGDLNETRRHLELARDAEGWDPAFSYSPRPSTVLQAALREFSTAPRTAVVDLPALYARRLDGAAPGRRFFLDYCHLTAEGITLAMAAVAAEAIALLTGKSIPANSLESKAPVPTPRIEGKTAFLAAVHNAHFYQSGELVRYWCDRALAAWPEGAKVMRRVADFQTRSAPLMACRSALELVAEDELGLADYLLRGKKQRLDPSLIDAIAGSLRGLGQEIEPDLSAQRREELSPRWGVRDLLDFYYASAIPGQWRRGWTSRSVATNRGSRAAYASAYWEKSTFVFVGESGRPVLIRLTCRLPAAAIAEGAIEIGINGQALDKGAIGHRWRTHQIGVPGDLVRDGLNEIVIAWPERGEDPDQARARAADALTALRLPRFHSVFGEIHALTVEEPSDSAP